MRISNQLMINNFLFNLRRISEDIDTSNRQLSTGLRFSRPSEAPIDMSLSLTLSEKIELTDQFGRNAEDGQTLMDFVDITLEGATEDAQAARTLILQGINGALSEDDREAVGAQINQLLENLVVLGNSTFNNKFIFSGYSTLTRTFESDRSLLDNLISNITFEGTRGDIDRMVGVGDRLSANVLGKDIFLRETYTIQGDSFALDKPLGFSGTFSVNGFSFSLDPTMELSDVSRMINTTDGIDFEAYIIDGALHIASNTSSGEVEIYEISGHAAEDLGILPLGAFNSTIGTPAALPLVDSTGAELVALNPFAGPLTIDDTNEILNLTIGPNADEDGIERQRSVFLERGTYNTLADLQTMLQTKIDEAFGEDVITVGDDGLGTLTLTTVETGGDVLVSDLRVGGTIGGVADTASDDLDLTVANAETTATNAGTYGNDKFSIELGPSATFDGIQQDPIEIDLRAANTNTAGEIVNEINYQIEHTRNLRGRVKAVLLPGDRIRLETTNIGEGVVKEDFVLGDVAAGTLSNLGFSTVETPAWVRGTTDPSGVVITAGVNDTFEIDLGPTISKDGRNIDPIQITLTAGAYATALDVVNEINTQINQSVELYGRIQAVVENVAGTDVVRIESIATGSVVRGEDIAINDVVGQNTLNDLGMAPGSGVNGGGTSDGLGRITEPANLYHTLLEARDDLYGYGEDITMLADITNLDGDFINLLDGDVVRIEADGSFQEFKLFSTDTLEDLARMIERTLGPDSEVVVLRTGQLEIRNHGTTSFNDISITATSANGVAREGFNEFFDNLASNVSGRSQIRSGQIRDTQRIQRLTMSAIDEIDVDLDTLTSTRAIVGSRSNRFSGTGALLDTQLTNLNSLMTEVTGANIPEVITQLSLQETILNSTLAVGAEIIPPSMLDYLLR